MELPDELLKIVRAYAKPLFRYSREYKQVVGFVNEWTELKEMLCGDQAEQVVEVVKRYLTACSEMDKLDEVFDGHTQRWVKVGTPTKPTTYEYCVFDGHTQRWFQVCIPNTDPQLTYGYWGFYEDLREICRRAKIYEDNIYEELVEMVGHRACMNQR